jgi:hypothetical protein
LKNSPVSALRKSHVVPPIACRERTIMISSSQSLVAFYVNALLPAHYSHCIAQNRHYAASLKDHQGHYKLLLRLQQTFYSSRAHEVAHIRPFQLPAVPVQCLLQVLRRKVSYFDTLATVPKPIINTFSRDVLVRHQTMMHESIDNLRQPSHAAKARGPYRKHKGICASTIDYEACLVPKPNYTLDMVTHQPRGDHHDQANSQHQEEC